MLTFHFLAVIGFAVLASIVVLRRYAAGARQGMLSVGECDLAVAPCPLWEKTKPLIVIEVGPATAASSLPQAAIQRERAACRRIASTYLLSAAACSLLISIVLLSISGIEITPGRLIALTGAMTGAAVPMIAISVGWPFWHGLLIWVALESVVALLSVIVPMAVRLMRAAEFDPMIAMNGVYVLQWTAISLAFPFALAFATGVRKLRGVAPLSLALISVLGLVPLLGSKGTESFRAGENKFFQANGATVAIYASYFVLAPVAGWIAWRTLKALSTAYDAKRFSDTQLISNVWWLIFVATLIAPLADNGGAWWVLLLAGVMSFVLFPILSGTVLSASAISGTDESRPTLLLLRLFGHTSRSERFFDRVVGRWRLLGPVTVISAPDIVARTFDTMDFLRFVTGRASQVFVESQQQLDQRLSALDLRPDPDGRYRVNTFWCRKNSWQATATALMSRCDAVVVDVRGLTAGPVGVRFELEQLAGRIPADHVVLVVDKNTDRAILESSVAAASGTLRLVRVERNSASETRRVFETLLAAARNAGNPAPPPRKA